jgi:hypothetical protein
MNMRRTEPLASRLVSKRCATRNARPPKAIALGGGEEVEEEGVVPAGAFDLAAGGALVAVGAQDVEGEAAQAGEVFGRMILAGAHPVLVEDDIEHPVQAVLDLPVGAHDREETGGGERPREQVVAGGERGPAVLLARGGDLADRPEAGKFVGFGEPGDVVDDRGAAGLDAAVVAVGGGGDVVSGSSRSSRTSSYSAGWLALRAST